MTRQWLVVLCLVAVLEAASLAGASMRQMSDQSVANTVQNLHSRAQKGAMRAAAAAGAVAATQQTKAPGFLTRLRRKRRPEKQPQETMRIPRILHQIFLDGLETLEQESAAPGTKFPKAWRVSCLEAHKHWEYHFWDLEAAEDLLRERYPWFLQTFRKYPNTVMKGDALRPFVLHAYGGMYIDMDVECFKPTDDLLVGFDIVFQSEYDGGHDINNAIIASVPGHPFWQQVAAILTHTAEELNFDKMDARMILDGTGPGIMRLAFKIYAYDVAMWEDTYVGTWTIQGSRMRVYGLGQWYVPCIWDRHACHKAIDRLKAEDALPKMLVGHHHYSGSWTKGLEEFKSYQEALLASQNSGRTIKLVAAVLLLAAVVLVYSVMSRRRKAGGSIRRSC